MLFHLSQKVFQGNEGSIYIIHNFDRPYMYYSCVVIIIPILVLLSYFTETNSIAVFLLYNLVGLFSLDVAIRQEILSVSVSSKLLLSFSIAAVWISL